MSDVTIVPVPALTDNYAYVIHEPTADATWVVDPSEAAPVERVLQKRGWTLQGIVNTHHHWDHVGGNQTLKDKFGISIYCSGYDRSRIAGADYGLEEGQEISIGNSLWKILAIPGHTLGHIALWSEKVGAVFTGDTLFLLGCGKIFEGTPTQMWSSLQKLAALPDGTRIYCGHEYTQANARFALHVDPLNKLLIRNFSVPTVPGNMAEEKAANPFLRAPTLLPNLSPVEALAHLRKQKNDF